ACHISLLFGVLGLSLSPSTAGVPGVGTTSVSVVGERAPTKLTPASDSVRKSTAAWKRASSVSLSTGFLSKTWTTTVRLRRSVESQASPVRKASGWTLCDEFQGR